MKVYIAGPMTGLVDFNFPAFHAAAADYRAAGHEVVNPAENGIPLDAPKEAHLRADIRALVDCDAVAMLPGWERSAGACLEFSIAEALGLVFMDVPG